MRVPFCENAEVDIRKLTDYVLNPNHADGKHKARMFKSALDLTADDAEPLSGGTVGSSRHERRGSKQNRYYGQRYTVDFYYEWKDKNAIVRSGWIIEFESNKPRLTTCYPL